MTITIEIPHDVEIQIREHAARGNAEAVRHLLIEALGPTLEASVVENDTNRLCLNV